MLSFTLTTISQLLFAAVCLAFLLAFVPRRQLHKAPEAPGADDLLQAHEQPFKDKDEDKQASSMAYAAALTDMDWTAVKQPYDAYLVLDVEATCMPGTDFNYANEIIEWPVCLLRWKYKDDRGKASRLEIVDEFRSFVKPVWRPQLSSFCTTLTGITQKDVDAAPDFATVLHTSFRDFLARNGLIDADTGVPRVRFCWCSDGPWDIRDFVVKQCFMSKISLPSWLAGDVLDVRRVVARWQEKNDPMRRARSSPGFSHSRGTFLPITRQLQVLGLGAFEGRQHCGIDDTRNVARILIELARQGMPLKPNTPINPHRRWPWMGKNGKVLEEYVQPVNTSL